MSAQNPVKPDARNLVASLGTARGAGLPPVHLWDPPFRGDLDIRIARDGTWFHEGAPIRRASMVRLFSSILRREGDDYFLVTPVEKVGIQVEDAPFVAPDFSVVDPGPDQVLIFETHVGDRVAAGPDHAIRMVRRHRDAEPAPYLHVRGGLEALIDRKSFYRMVDLGTVETVDGAAWFGIRSGGLFFAIAPAGDLGG